MPTIALVGAAACAGVHGPNDRRANPTPRDVASVTTFVDALPRCDARGDEIDIGEALEGAFAPGRIRARGWLQMGGGTGRALACFRMATRDDDLSSLGKSPEKERTCCNGCGGFWVLGAGAGDPDEASSVALLAHDGSPLSWSGMDCSLDEMEARGVVDVIATGVLRERTQHWSGAKAEVAEAQLCAVVSDR